jgi:hypothetical protein
VKRARAKAARAWVDAYVRDCDYGIGSDGSDGMDDLAAELTPVIREQQLAFGQRIARWLQQVGGPLEPHLERILDEEGA